MTTTVYISFANILIVRRTGEKNKSCLLNAKDIHQNSSVFFFNSLFFTSIFIDHPSLAWLGIVFLFQADCSQGSL